jgi:NADH-quinone oxidoreductase subunit N
MDFVKPTVEYGQLLPLLIVFGVACAGVLVEAFAPRSVRFGVQTVLTGVGLLGALAATIWLATDLDSIADGAAKGGIRMEGTITVDGPTVFIWGIVLVFALGGALLFAESPARRPRCPAPRPSARRPPEAWSTPRSTR